MMDGRGATHKASRPRDARHARVLRVILTALVTFLLCAGYVLGDCWDVLPGYLTLSPGASSADARGHAGPSWQGAGSPLVASYGDSGRARPPIDSGALKAAVTAFTSDTSLSPDYSFRILDQTGTEIAGHDADTPREPASTTKTVTALAAVSVLDMNSTLDTRVFLDPAPGGKSDGKSGAATLILRGQGDMLLGAGRSDPTHVIGRAGLATLASQVAQALKARGVTTVGLAVDDTFFGPRVLPSSMDKDYVANGLFSPTASLAIDQGKEWDSAPATNPDGTVREYAKRPDDPVPPAAASFARSLSSQGISVVTGQDGSVRATAAQVASEARLKQVGVVRSAPLWQLLRLALNISDNTIAEEFGRLVAREEHQANTPDGAVRAVTSVVASLGVDLSGVHLSDCSGLSDGTRLTATALTQVQERYYRWAGAAAAEGLAVAGIPDTTLAERHLDKATYGYLRAKTGSLDHATALAGTVTRRKGGFVSFAILVNNPVNRYGAIKAINSFVAALTGI